MSQTLDTVRRVTMVTCQVNSSSSLSCDNSHIAPCQPKTPPSTVSGMQSAGVRSVKVVQSGDDDAVANVNSMQRPPTVKSSFRKGPWVGHMCGVTTSIGRIGPKAPPIVAL